MSVGDQNALASSLQQANDAAYHLFVDSVRDYAIYLLDTSGRIVSWNAAAQRMKGYTADDVLGKSYDMMFAPEAVALGEPRRDLEAALAQGTFEDEGLRKRKDGTTFRGIYTITPLYEASSHVGFAVIVRDVTKQRQQELLLRRSEQRYRSLVDATTLIVWAAAADGSVFEDMTGWHEFSGMMEQETAGWGWLEAVHPDDRPGAADRWSNAIELQQPYHSEYRMRREDGQWRYIVARAVPIKNEHGKVVEWVGVCEDITEAKQAEAAILASERRYRALVENSWDGVILVNERCEFIDITPAGERILGYTKNELQGSSGFAIVFAGELDESRELFDVILHSPGKLFRTQRKLQRRDGAICCLELTTVNLLDEPSIGAIVVNFRDITEQQQLEQQYLQAQKMEAVGQLAAGVAHDFNNILTVIKSYCYMLLKHRTLDEQTRSFLTEIESAGGRAETLTRQLLSFSRRHVTEERVLDLNAIVSDTESMIRRLIGEQVRLEIVLAPEVGTIKADKGQIEQVLVNLVVNARDAMPSGGVLRIATANVDLDESYCQQHADVAPGTYTNLVVTDTGAGMDEATQARIFEPFFTTKEVGKGTGLGLATIYNIVAQSQGHIEVRSTRGVGTSFLIYLPQADSEPTVLTGDEPMTDAGQGSETILLVEDEESVRLLIRRILEQGGYTVMEASNGREALKIMEEYRDAIDLVVSDVVMPHLGGRQLAERIAAVRPDCKILFASGYTDDEMIRQGIQSHSFEFIRKPLTPDALLAKVREMLDANHTSV
ncbi:PAS domain S-box protein [Aeoliella sp.]|uniref:PAS domain S-box protein n=1 Tax=Aeoliella sp. TaxID=2795800 RepID=UPI003CCB97D7